MELDKVMGIVLKGESVTAKKFVVASGSVRVIYLGLGFIGMGGVDLKELLAVNLDKVSGGLKVF